MNATLRALIASIIIFSWLPATARSQSDQLRIGLIAPMTGDLAQYGTAALNGLTLANERESGPVAKILLEDNRSCGPTDAVPAAQKLVNIDKVDILVTVCTGAAQGVLPIAVAHKIPLFQITESGPDTNHYMIKMMPDAVGLVDVLAEKYVKRYPKMALIGATIQVNTGERGNLTLFRKKFESLGGEIVFYEEFPSEVLDFKSVIERIKQSEAQAVIPFLAPAQQLAIFLKQADQLKLWKRCSLAGNFFFEFMLKDLTELYPALRKLNGLESSNLAQLTSDKFKEQYKTKFGQPAPQFADYAYDSMSIIKRCALNADCYRRPFEGVSGIVEFDPSTDRRIGKFVSRQLLNGIFVDQKQP